MANKYSFSKCHPDRLHMAKGLCGPCYAKRNHAANREARLAQMRAYNRDVRHDRRKRRPAPCHVDRPHYAHGLCEPCYHQSAHAKALRKARHESKSPQPVGAGKSRATVAPAPATPTSALSFFRKPK